LITPKNNNQELEIIFAIFHDGGIEKYLINESDISLEIGIEYLAELIDPNFNKFNLNIFGVEIFEFEPWIEKPEKITDWKSILELNLGFLSTEINTSDEITLHCTCYNAPNDEYEGGKLKLKCPDYKLTDELGNRITVDRLIKVSKHYWNEVFGK